MAAACQNPGDKSTNLTDREVDLRWRCGHVPSAPERGLPPAHDPKALNWLLRRAVRGYRGPVGGALGDAGFGDLPQQGIWAVSALAESKPGLSGRDLVAGMGISKQAVSQLVDTSGGRPGTWRRRPSPVDRRRTLLHLTPRGRGAVRVIDEAVAGVEPQWPPRSALDELLRLYRALQDLDDE